MSEAPVAADKVEVEDPRDPDDPTLMWTLCHKTAELAATLCFDFHAYHADRIPRTGGVLLLANHQSYLDPPLLALKPPRQCAFLAKSGLFKFGPFGWLIRKLNAFPVKQGAGDVGAMKESIRLLQNGWMLTMFPEGTRSPDGELQPIERGAGLLVKRAQVPVVPAVIDGAWDAWPPDGPAAPRLKPIRALYGEPEDLSHLKAADIQSWTADKLAALLEQLRSGRVG